MTEIALPNEEKKKPRAASAKPINPPKEMKAKAKAKKPFGPQKAKPSAAQKKAAADAIKELAAETKAAPKRAAKKPSADAMKKAAEKLEANVKKAATAKAPKEKKEPVKKQGFLLRLDDEQVKALDAARGDLSRPAFMLKAVLAKLPKA